MATHCLLDKGVKALLQLLPGTGQAPFVQGRQQGIDRQDQGMNAAQCLGSSAHGGAALSFDPSDQLSRDYG